MGNPGGEDAQGGHFFGLHQLVLAFLQLRPHAVKGLHHLLGFIPGVPDGQRQEIAPGDAEVAFSITLRG